MTIHHGQIQTSYNSFTLVSEKKVWTKCRNGHESKVFLGVVVDSHDITIRQSSVMKNQSRIRIEHVEKHVLEAAGESQHALRAEGSAERDGKDNLADLICGLLSCKLKPQVLENAVAKIEVSSEEDIWLTSKLGYGRSHQVSSHDGFRHCRWV